METTGVVNNGVFRTGDAAALWRAKPGTKRPRLRVPVTLESALDRAMHTAFLKAKGADGNRASRQVQEICERSHRPWRILARRFVELREAGVCYRDARGVLEAFEHWLVCVWGGEVAP